MTNITAKIVADSISSTGKRLTTFELEYPRFIHAEFMTHRMISKNSASSRAIPVKKMIENVQANPAVPTYWGKNQAGMSAKEECYNEVDPIAIILAIAAELKLSEEEAKQRLMMAQPQSFTAEGAWKAALTVAAFQAAEFDRAGYHKQIVNRLIEPFQMIKVVATATEWDNFFWLRNHADAQPEIRVLAEKMLEAYKENTPVSLTADDWHTPYFGAGYWLKDCGIPLQDALAISSSCCAQVSYRKADDTLEKALVIYNRLVESKPVHASPFEHCGSPIPTDADWNYQGVTSNHKALGLMSGNFAGFIQYRQLIDNHTCWRYEHE